MATRAGDSAPPTPPSPPPTQPDTRRASQSARRLALAGAETPPTTPSAAAADLSPETDGPRLPTVARDTYEIAGKFAQGGIGRILKATDPVLGRTVALKELLVAGHKHDEDRFIREVMLTARLQHPGIVPVYAAGRWPSGEPFYAMKLVSGRSFDRVIAGAHTVAARLALLPHVLAIAETVAYAHAQGIIHRDLKPGNVLVGEFGETVVIDWGLAKQLVHDEPPAEWQPTSPPPPKHAVDPAAITRVLDPPRRPDDPPPAEPEPEPERPLAPRPARAPRTQHPAPPPADPDLPTILDHAPAAPVDPEPVPDIPEAPEAPALTAVPHDMSSRPGSAPRPTAVTAQLTRVGAIVGTPGYMSPEQADGAETDARTDVFALGAILYHTLSGRLPYDADNVASLIFKTVYESPVPLRERVPDLPEELVAIVDKAMARAPADRYPTARAFADDLRRFQTGQIVGAHRYTAWEHLVRLVRRWRTQLIVVAAALVVIVVVVVLAFQRVDKERAEAVTARAAAVARLDAVSFEYARQRTDDDPAAAIDLLAGLSEQADWRRIRQIAAGVHARGLPRVLHGHTGAVSRAAFAPDNTRLATTSDDCTLRVWDLSSGTSDAYYGHTDEVYRAAWSPDLRRIATSSRDRTVRVWDLETGDAQVLHGHQASVRNVAFTPDGRTIYSSDDDEQLLRWDLDTGASTLLDHCGANNFPWSGPVIGCMTPHAVILHDLRTGDREVLHSDGPRFNYNGVISPDDRWVAAGTTNRAVWLWDRTAASARLLAWPDDIGLAGQNTREMRFSPDARRLAVPLRTQYLALWDLPLGTLALSTPHSGYTRRAAFSPDGALLASVGGDNTVNVRDTISASDRALVGTRAFLIDAQFSRDGQHLAAVGNDPRVFVWSDDGFRPRMWRLGEGPAIAAEAPDRDLVAVAGGSAIAVVDERTLQPVARMTAPRPVSDIALRPDASQLLSLDHAGEFHVWDPATGAYVRGGPSVPPDGHCSLVVSPAPLPVLVYCDDRAAYRVDPATVITTRVDSLTHHATYGRFGDRDLFILGGEDGRVVTLDVRTHETTLLHTYAEWIQWLGSIRHTPQLLVASERVVDLWDLTTHTRRSLAEHTLQVDSFHVSADGRRIVTSSRDHVLRVFDLDTLDLLHIIVPGQIVGSGVRLSPDGTNLVADQQDGTILLWDLQSERPDEARKLTGATRAFDVLRFTADGSALVGASYDGRVLRWADDLPRDGAGIRQWIAAHHEPGAAEARIVPGCAVPPRP